MSQDEFTKLFLYVKDHFDKVEKRLEDTSTKQDIDNLLIAMDACADQSTSTLRS